MQNPTVIDRNHVAYPTVFKEERRAALRDGPGPDAEARREREAAARRRAEEEAEEEARPETDECGICLSALPDGDARFPLTRCSHVYCAACVGEYATRKLRPAAREATAAAARRAVRDTRCPTCATPLGLACLRALLVHRLVKPSARAEVVLERATEASAAGEEEQEEEAGEEPMQRPAPPVDPEAERRFSEWARVRHIKLCPHCTAPIEKIGGCRNMRCNACKTGFRWDQVSLACPCRGYHHKRAYPFVELCAHMKREDIRPVHRATYLLKKGLALAPLLALAAPVLAVAVPAGLAFNQLREWRRKQRKLAVRRRREAIQRSLLRQRAAEQRRRVSCRTTGRHQWVVGWCTQCGATDATAIARSASLRTMELAIAERGAGGATGAAGREGRGAPPWSRPPPPRARPRDAPSPEAEDTGVMEDEGWDQYIAATRAGRRGRSTLGASETPLERALAQHALAHAPPLAEAPEEEEELAALVAALRARHPGRPVAEAGQLVRVRGCEGRGAGCNGVYEEVAPGLWERLQPGTSAVTRAPATPTIYYHRPSRRWRMNDNGSRGGWFYETSPDVSHGAPDPPSLHPAPFVLRAGIRNAASRAEPAPFMPAAGAAGLPTVALVPRAALVLLAAATAAEEEASEAASEAAVRAGASGGPPPPRALPTNERCFDCDDLPSQAAGPPPSPRPALRRAHSCPALESEVFFRGV